MKKLIFVTVALLLSQSFAHAAPYYRFWRGWKLDTLSDSGFQMGLNSSLIPATIQVGAGKGLIGYLPFLPTISKNKFVPDELALVIYSDEASYRQIRSTKAGQAYADLHWQFFDQSKGSKSLVPEPYIGNIENEKSYDILQSNADWKKGHVIFTTSVIKGDFRPYLNSMKHEFSRKGLASHVVLVQGKLLYEYQLWKDRASLQVSWPILRKKASSDLVLWWAGSSELPKKNWNNSQIRPGMGINVIF